MSQQPENPDYFDRVNLDLAQSLRRCHALVDDYRDVLAANSNEPRGASRDEHENEEEVG